jgi:MFS family permease
MTFLQPLRNVAQRIALVESVSGEERDGVFAAYRLVVSVGTLAGPLLGSGLVGVGWWALHLEVVVICLISLSCVMHLSTSTMIPTEGFQGGPRMSDSGTGGNGQGSHAVERGV